MTDRDTTETDSRFIPYRQYVYRYGTTDSPIAREKYDGISVVTTNEIPSDDPETPPTTVTVSWQVTWEEIDRGTDLSVEQTINTGSVERFLDQLLEWKGHVKRFLDVLDPR